MSRKSLLMILYYFPPCGSSGVLRSVRFVRGLKSMGHSPVILTVAERDIDKLAYGTVSHDESHRDVESGLSILRARAIRPSYLALVFLKWCLRAARGVARSIRNIVAYPARRLANSRGGASSPASGPDPSPPGRNVKSYYSAETGPFMKFVFDLVLIIDTLFEWAPQAFFVALRRVGKSGISHVYSSSPPLSGHYVALWLKLVWRKRWIMDLRDPLFDVDASAVGGRRPTGLIRAYYRLVEWILVRNADVVICNCEEIRTHYRSRHPRARFEVITNSYDADVVSDRTEDVRGVADIRSPFVISHFGLLYPTVRTPDAFLGALHAAIQERPELGERVRVDFVGDRGYTSSASFRNALRALGLDSVVECGGYVPHDKVLARMAASDLLLLLQPHASTRYQIPAKLFEYLAARRPILAVAPDGSATHGIIRLHGLGFVRDPSDVSGLAADILRVFDGAGPMASEDALKAFSSAATTSQLAKILDSLM